MFECGIQSVEDLGYVGGGGIAFSFFSHLTFPRLDPRSIVTVEEASGRAGGRSEAPQG